MKKEFDVCPETIDRSRLYGFSWMEYMLAIPSPLVVVTGYKANGKPNATMQSWCVFAGTDDYYCIFANVNRESHMYSSIKQTGECVINFPSKDILGKCMMTIENNDYDFDEISKSGLTAEPAARVNAPRIAECFLNLECSYAWERELCPGSNSVIICVKIENICMDEERYNEQKLGRYGETGYLYNIRSRRNPDTGEVKPQSVGIIQNHTTYDKL